LSFLQQVRKHLSPDGNFILSVWQFMNSARLAARVRPWEILNLHSSDLEPGDTLLDWRAGGVGLRYAHFFNEDELDELANRSGFRVCETFHSDGKEHNLGLYQVWKIA
jgi:hypothetical protein